MEKKKVGIMGGTFNPIHNWHLAMAQQALEEFDLDSVLFIPSGTPYLKDQREVLPGEIRAKMTELAIADNPSFSLSKMEIEREGNTYTYETIASLKEQNPGTEYYFIVGADSFLYMENWVKPEKIFGEVILLVAIRDGIEKDELILRMEEMIRKYSCDIRLLTVKYSDLSSTYLRKCVKSGKSIRYYVPLKVCEYIEKLKLFLDNGGCRADEDKRYHQDS